MYIQSITKMRYLCRKKEKEREKVFFTKQMKTEHKITVGYIVLIILSVTAMWYIYSEIKEHTHSNRYNKELSAHSRITREMMLNLNRAEITGQAIAAGEFEKYSTYIEAMRRASSALDTLRTRSNDSIRSARLDTMQLLIERKNSCMRQLVSIIKETSTNDLLQEQIDDLISLQDSITRERGDIRDRVVTRTKRHTAPASQKGFFKRLGELFVPAKGDSVVISDTIEEEYTQEAWEREIAADSIATLLRNVQENSIASRKQYIREIGETVNSLILNSLALSNRVNRLLNTIEEEEQRWIIQQEIEQQELRASSMMAIAGIAIISVPLATLFLFFIWRDITRSTHYRKELEKAKERAEELLQTRENLMLTITHDIKAPTGSILGYTELLEETNDELRQRDYIHNIKESARLLLQLVNSLLDFHRLDSGKMEATIVPFNAKQLTDAIADSFRPLAAQKGIELRYSCDPTLDATFTSDPLRMRQIIGNLMENAFKFTSQGAVTLSATRKEEYIQFTVSDTGCGIAPEEQQKLYKEFTRLSNAQGKEGFGLGLSITHKLVELLKGALSMESTIGEGTTFHIRIPAERSTAPTTEHFEREETVTTTIPEQKILMIDDDTLQLQLTKRMLNGTGAAITTCTEIEKFTEELQNERYDVIITDIQMPGMNGIELMRVLKKHPKAKDIPVIAVTARSDMSSDNMSAHGFSGVLHKPFSRSELLRSIAECRNNRAFCFDELTAFSMDENDATEIVHTFISGLKEKRKRLQEAVSKRDMKMVTDTTHRLLPLFAMINATASLPHLEWFEKRRDETLLSQEAEEKIEIIIKEIKAVTDEAITTFGNSDRKQ